MLQVIYASQHYNLQCNIKSIVYSIYSSRFANDYIVKLVSFKINFKWEVDDGRSSKCKNRWNKQFNIQYRPI